MANFSAKKTLYNSVECRMLYVGGYLNDNICDWKEKTS